MKQLLTLLSLITIGGHLFAQQTFTLKSNGLGGQATDRQFANTIIGSFSHFTRIFAHRFTE